MHRAFTLALLACSGSTPTDGGVDAGPEAIDIAFQAEPDPSERRDCPAEIPAEGEARAKHITCASELIDGSLAMGRAGDIVIENARVRFIVREGDQSAMVIGAPAGGVIDAAVHGGPDLLKELFPLFDFASMQSTAIEVVDADEARVRVLFEDAPIGLVETVLPGLSARVRLRGQMDYVLRPDSDALEIELSITTEEGTTRSGAATGVLALFGSAELWQPGYGLLFDERLGTEGIPAVIGERESALALALEGGGAVTSFGSIEMIKGPRLTFVRGSITEVRARLAVADTAAHALDAAIVSSDPILSIEGTPGERVEVLDGDAVRLRTLLDEQGRAQVRLPAGAYTIRPGFRGYFAGDVAIDHPGDPITVAPAPSGTLTIAATVEGDATVPVRVTVSSAEELERFTARGETSRRLPPGTYTITVSHGLEYDSFSTELTIADGAAMTLSPDLARAIDTTNWVSVDLHLHSDLSTDSRHAVEDAIRLLAAEGVQAAAATDHDFITDYASVAARAAVDDLLVVVPGVEVSTTVFGHVNGYPLVPDPDLAGQGAPVWFEMSPAQVFDGLRAIGDPELGGALVQINHPRLGSASFFGSIALDRETGHATADPSVLDLPADTDLDDFGFDVLEVWNGYTRGENEASFEDYLMLFANGRRFTMVGNSDSHIPDRPPGSPRSFVQVDDESAFDWTDIAAALRAGRVTVAAGVFVTAELAGPRAGDSVPVHVVVQAPPWAVTTSLRIYSGRTVAVERAITSSEPVRLDEVIDVPLSGNDFVVVRVDGDRVPDPIQHYEPSGVTNPLIVP